MSLHKAQNRAAEKMWPIAVAWNPPHVVCDHLHVPFQASTLNQRSKWSSRTKRHLRHPRPFHRRCWGSPGTGRKWWRQGYRKLNHVHPGPKLSMTMPKWKKMQWEDQLLSAHSEVTTNPLATRSAGEAALFLKANGPSACNEALGAEGQDPGEVENVPNTSKYQICKTKNPPIFHPLHPSAAGERRWHIREATQFGSIAATKPQAQHTGEAEDNTHGVKMSALH